MHILHGWYSYQRELEFALLSGLALHTCTYIYMYSTGQKKVANTVYCFALLMLTVCLFLFRYQRRSVLSFYRFVYRFIVLLCPYHFTWATERVKTVGECLKVHTVSMWSIARQFWRLTIVRSRPESRPFPFERDSAICKKPVLGVNAAMAVDLRLEFIHLAY